MDEMTQKINEAATAAITKLMENIYNHHGCAAGTNKIHMNFDLDWKNQQVEATAKATVVVFAFGYNREFNHLKGK